MFFDDNATKRKCLICNEPVESDVVQGTSSRVKWHSFTQFFGIAGELLLPKEDSADIEQLILMQCSAKRSIYEFLSANPGKEAEVYKAVKPRYTDLPSRYFNAVVALAKQLPIDQKVVFGGRVSWRKYKEGIISKKTWLERKNNTLYSQALGKSNELLMLDRRPNGQVFLKRSFPPIPAF